MQITRWLPGRACILVVTSLAMATMASVQAQTVLTVAAFPAVDDIVHSAIAHWKRLHPDIDIKVVSQQFTTITPP